MRTAVHRHKDSQMASIGLSSSQERLASSLRKGLVAIVVVTAAPITLLMAWLIAQQLQTEQARFESGLQEQTALLARTLDQELASSVAALTILAVADTIQRDDVAGFFNSVATLPSEPGKWQGVFLVAPNGSIVFNTRQPQGKPLGVFSDLGALETLKQSMRPVTSDLIASPDGRLKPSVLVPVIRKGQVRYALGAWIAPQAWCELISDPSSFIRQAKGAVTIADRQLLPIPCEPAGKMAPTPPSGALRATTPYATGQMIGTSGWRVRVIVPAWPRAVTRFGSAAEIGLACLLIWVAAAAFALRVARHFDEQLDAAPAPRTVEGPPRPDWEQQHLVELAQSVGQIGFFNLAFHSRQATWTSGLSRLLGIGFPPLEGSFRRLLRQLHPQDRRQVLRQVKQAIHSGCAHFTIEGRSRPDDPNEKWLSCRVSMIYGDPHQAISMTGVVTDVSQQKMLDRERAALMAHEQIARRDAENANRAKDEFLAMLGHELRNPLGAISAACEVLNRSDAQPDVAQRARQIIARQTRHLSRLMDDLLDVFRVISGKVLLVRYPLLLGQVVQRVIHTLELAGHLRAHKLTLQLDDVWVHADATRMEQVVNNLVSNALKYTPERGHIEISLHQVDDAAVLQVRDSGVGMTPELMSKVFDMFVQGERSMARTQGGLGIGLALVRRLIDLHGGQVTVDSAGPDQGSTFTVHLPLAHAEEVPAVTRPSDGSNKSRRVVVVEDNDDAREALCTLLTLNHHDIYAATDGQSGLDLILKVQPDVALIDIGLPGLTGYEVAQHLRATAYAGCLIAVSGYGQPTDINRARSAGFNEHLVKPVDPTLLEQMLSPLSG